MTNLIKYYIIKQINKIERDNKMDTNKIMLQSIIAPPEFRTLSNYKDKFNKLSYLSKKQYNMVEEFYFNYCCLQLTLLVTT